MTESDIIDLIREAIWLTIKIGAPVMFVGLIVGVLVALIQALTQIQEMTLVFVPKILAMFAAMFVLLPMMTVTLIDFMQRLADKIVVAGGGP
jgi:flagellar biosynthesis protein FliQ